MQLVTPPPVEFDQQDMFVRFSRFDLASYEVFLKIKAIPEYHVQFDRETEAYTIRAPKRFAGMLGVVPPAPQAPDLGLSAFLFDDQSAIVQLALAAKRFAVWSDCGLGKTLIEFEFARHVIHRTGGRVLIVTMNDLVDQFIEMAAEFYGESLPLTKLTSQKHMREWCQGTGPGLAIVNYEKFNPEDGSNDKQVISEVRHLAGLILDESSRLKTGGGKQKWAIIKSGKGIEYKLSCTATPAPNDTMEFASQASFLERMRSEGEIIWTYFHRDKKTHRWTVKKHAREGFFKFMASWSIYVRDPRKYGWRKDHAPVPEPITTITEIEATPEQLAAMRALQRDATGQMRMFEKDNTNAIERVKLSEVAKGFRYHEKLPTEPVIPADAVTLKRKGIEYRRWTEYIPSRKPAVVAAMAAKELAEGRQVLIWTEFDAETRLIAHELKLLGIEPDVLTGSTPKKLRPGILDRFRNGGSQLLIGRSKMIGYGQNFQRCKSMIFSGWSDSFEAFYQSVRRAVRHGQTDQVRVLIPVIRELEGDQLDNVFLKEAKHSAAVDEMERNYIGAMKGLCL